MRRTNAGLATQAQRLTLALTVTLTMALAAGGCRRRAEIVDGVSDSAFVATMVELRRLGTTAPLDSAASAEARARVLQRRGLTAARFERAAAALADDPEHAQRVFARVDSAIAAADSSRRLTPQPSPPPTPRPAAPKNAGGVRRVPLPAK